MLRWAVYEEHKILSKDRELSAIFKLESDARFYARTMNDLYKSTGNNTTFIVEKSHFDIDTLAR